MRFAPLAKALGLPLLSLTVQSTTDAHESHSSDYPIVSNDLRCPEGSFPGFVHNDYTYSGPLAGFTNITGSFFATAWYGGVSPSKTTGTDNVPGATRGGEVGGGAVNETLTMFLARPDALSYTFHGSPWTGTLSNGRPLHLALYAETKRFESICGGTATYIDFLTYLCSDDRTAAYNLWYTAHMKAVQGLAVTLGATVLAGDCSTECG
ncbi:hypothetical protein FB451DRAFT_1370315 [Mycena latifolia]|nr:hypothetical protein FB451DRAFT_1370315 [Mycena latifolia]